MKTLLALLLLAQMIGAEPVPKILMEYRCAGTDSRGPYQSALIIETHGENYFLTWSVGWQGVGFRTGNELVVAFISTSPSGPNQFTVSGFGPMLYQIGNAELTGEWAAGGKIYTESCRLGMPA